MFGLFEDGYAEYLIPLTYTRPVFELRSGIYTLRERIEATLKKAGLTNSLELLLVRNELAEPYSRILRRYKINEIPYPDEELILINGRLILTDDILNIISIPKSNLVLTHGREILLIKLSRHIVKEMGEVLSRPLGDEVLNLLKRSVEVVEVSKPMLIRALWDLLDMNKKLIELDLSLSDITSFRQGNSKTYCAGEVSEKAVLNDKSGPIVIERGAVIEDFAYVEGPSYIARGCRINDHSHVSNCSLGPKTTISGYVEQTIIQGYSDVMPYTFLRTSYIGEWVLIGPNVAITDVKLTLGSIKFKVDDVVVDTGFMELGSFIGDLAKFASGTTIFPGKIIGVASQVIGIVDRNIPSFTLWHGYSKSSRKLELDKVLEIYKRYAYLKEEMPSYAYMDVLKKLYSETT